MLVSYVSSLASLETLRSLRLALKAPVMQATEVFEP